MARSECTSASVSSKDWAGTSTRSLTPVGQLESCSKHLRVLRERSHCQSGSTKRIPKRVRVRLSRTSRTDEAAERCRLHGRRPLSLEAARDGVFFHDVFAQNNANLPRKHAQNDAFGHPTLELRCLDRRTVGRFFTRFLQVDRIARARRAADQPPPGSARSGRGRKDEKKEPAAIA